MPLHPQAQSLLLLIEQLGAPAIEAGTPQQARDARKARQLPATEPVHEIRDLDAGGVPARLYRPNAANDLGLLVYFHGGGWVLGDLDSHETVCRSLANRSGQAVLSVQYRLAPEYPFPAPLGDAIQATRWAHTNATAMGCDPNRLAVGGDSAGANLAAVVAQIAPVPLRFQMLIYPVTDCRCITASYTENASGYFLTAAGMSWFIDHYLCGGHGSPEDPRVSPLLADDAIVRATPPALVITAEFDPLRDEGDQYAKRLADLGVMTTHVRFNGMFHGFFSLPEFIDDAKAAHALAAQALVSAIAL
jgi:acetyl esterase